MWKLGDYVKLRTCDEWNSLYGIVDEIYGDILAVVCVTMPCYRYYVELSNADIILEPVGL